MISPESVDSRLRGNDAVPWDASRALRNHAAKGFSKIAKYRSKLRETGRNNRSYLPTSQPNNGNETQEGTTK
jgi:hypothetical protein